MTKKLAARTFKTGARPSPRHRLLAAVPHVTLEAVPSQFAYVPAKLDPWGNKDFGCCVTSEEAFAKACHAPEIFIDSATVVAWARAHGVLEGASLTGVLDSMMNDGFRVGAQSYNDGGHQGVDYSDEPTLQSALSQGPVKIAIDHLALPKDAGLKQGWYAVGGPKRSNADHCTALCGYGPAGWLYQQLRVSLPAALKADQAGYLCFTWGSIGFVDHAWVMNTCVEAWLRVPTTVGVPPLPNPNPTPDPFPTPDPTPKLMTVTVNRAIPAGGMVPSFRTKVAIPAGSYDWVPVVRGMAEYETIEAV